MRLIPDSNNIARIIEIPGVKKTTEYLFIGTGFALVALGSVCYLITAIKSHGRIKEQNDVGSNRFKIFLENLSTNDRRFPLTEEGPGCEPN